MANILTIACTDDVVTLTLDDATGLVVGETVTIFNTGYPKLDHVHTLTSVDLGTDTVQYLVNNQDDIETTSVSGAVLSAIVTWADDDDVKVWLGISAATANDEAFIAYCVEAANCYGYRVRYEAGYKDSPTASPCPSAKLGVIMMAGSLYRERGSVDSFASFDQTGTAVPFGTMARIKQLLGVGRPQVG